MNKINIVNDKIKSKNIKKSIEIDFIENKSLFGINKIIISVKRNTSLNIEINNDKISKLEIVLNVLSNKKINLNIITKGNDLKIQYKYNLDKNSICNINKFNVVKNIREMIISNLDENSEFNYNFKTISTSYEKYDYTIYHNSDNTISNIKNNGININEGILVYNVSTFIPKNIKNASANQYNRIINLSDNECIIKPNLYIDSYDVEANHSALIGGFNDDEMFYLKSRGIDELSATILLIKGFLLSGVDDKNIENLIIKTINKYWR